MRIGIDCRLWNESGVGRYIRNLVENLAKIDRKNSYVLFVLSKDFNNIKYQISKIKNNWKLEIGNWKLRLADARWHTIEEQLKLPQIINKENLDLMHFPYVSVPIFYHKPFVVTIHDLIPLHFPTGQGSTLVLPLYYLKYLAYRLVISQAAKKAKKIITVSNATKKETVDHLNVSSDKVVVTYEGIDGKITNSKSPHFVRRSLTSRGKQIPNKSQNTKYSILNTQYFLYVGNAYPHKNLERLLKAFLAFCHPAVRRQRLCRRHEASAERPHDVKLVLVGKADCFYKRFKKKVVEMKLSDKVIFLQDVNDGELASLYKNAIALVLPSLMEGFGLPALEAMANKCLVLASDIPSLKETCGNTASYFNPLSVDELSEKLNMVTLLIQEYAGLEKLRKRGIERAKLFSWKKMAIETLKVYEEVTLSPQV